MDLNPKLLNKLGKLGVHDLDSCLTFLFTLTYQLKDSPIDPRDLVTLQINKVLVMDLIKGEFVCKIPLFVGMEVPDDLESIEDYLKLFRQYGIYGDNKLARKRILRFLKENPKYSYADIISATEYYVTKTAKKFIRKPHYFLYKRVGGEEVSTISEILEELNHKQQTSDDEELM